MCERRGGHQNVGSGDRAALACSFILEQTSIAGQFKIDLIVAQST